MKKTSEKASRQQKTPAKKNAKPAKTTPSPRVVRTTAQLDAAQMLLQANSPEKQKEAAKAVLAQMLSRFGRMETLIQHCQNKDVALDGRMDNIVADINHQLEYFNQCLIMLFEAVHLDMPVRLPRVEDVAIELLDEPAKGEESLMQAAYFEKEHPTFGHIQVIIGGEGGKVTHGLQTLRPLLAKRMGEAFDRLNSEKRLVDGHFYHVRMGICHTGRLNDESVPVEQLPAKDAA